MLVLVCSLYLLEICIYGVKSVNAHNNNDNDVFIAQRVGQGSYCHAYHIERNTRTASYKMFASVNIHGIRIG